MDFVGEGNIDAENEIAGAMTTRWYFNRSEEIGLQRELALIERELLDLGL